MALSGLKAMLAGALRDRLAAAGVIAGAGLLLLTAWVLAVIALVQFLAPRLGMVGALLAVAGGLVVVALILIWSIGAHNRRSAELRASTRALWAATAVNAASAILRDGEAHPVETGTDRASGKLRKAALVAGGIALMLLALLVPSGRDKDPGATGEDGDGPGAGDAV